MQTRRSSHRPLGWMFVGIISLALVGCQGGGQSGLTPDPAHEATGGPGATLLKESTARHLSDLTLDGASILAHGYWYTGTAPGQEREFAIVPSKGSDLSARWSVEGSGEMAATSAEGLTFRWTASLAEGEARVRVTIETPDGSLERLFRFNVQTNPPAHRFPIAPVMAEVPTHDPYAAAGDPADYNIAEGDILIQVAGDSEATDLRAALVALHLQILYRFEGRPAYQCYNASGRDLWAVIADLRALPFVTFAEPNGMHYLDTITPDDPDYALQYCLPLQKANDAWEIGQGSDQQILAIMDTGTGRQHPDLADKVVDGADFVTPPGDGLGGEVPGDGVGADNNVGHGVHCSGISAAISNNTLGGAGMSWNSRLMGLRIFPAGGEGGASSASIIGAHDYIRDYNQNPDNLIKVVGCNMSFGGGGASEMTQDAIDGGTDAGITYAAAAGNGGSFFTAYYPAGYDHVLATASINNLDVKAGSSNWGPFVDLSAAGVSIWNTYYDGDPNATEPNIYAFLSGTSMATPQVNGLVGLIKGWAPELTPAQVAEVILRTCDDIDPLNPDYAGQMGAGRINAFAALQADLSAQLAADGTFQMDDSQYGLAQGDRDGRINPGEKVRILPAIANVGIRDAVDYQATIDGPVDPYISFVVPTITIANVSTGAGITSDEWFTLKVAYDAPDNYEQTITYTVTDPSGLTGPWNFDFSVRIERDDLVVDTADGTVTDLTGGVAYRPAVDYPFFAVDLTAATNYLTIEWLRVSLLGTIDPASITNVRLWRDNGDLSFNPSSDTELGLVSYWNSTYASQFDRQNDPASHTGTPQERDMYSGGAFVAGSVLFQGLRLPATEGEAFRLYVSADIERSARSGETVGLAVLSEDDVQVSVPDIAASLPWGSAEVPIINSWSPEQPLTLSDGSAWRQRAALDGAGHVYVTYDSDTFGDFDIYLKTSTDGGLTWSADERAITTNGSNDFYPDVAIGPAGEVYIAFYSTRDGGGNREIYFMSSNDFGETFAPETRVTNASGGSRVPRLLHADGVTHLVWYDERVQTGKYEIYYSASVDGGANWGTQDPISATPAGSTAQDPEVVYAGDRLYVAWDEHGGWNAPGANSHVVYNIKQDAGTWGTPRMIAGGGGAGGAAYGVKLQPTVDGRAYAAYHSTETGTRQIWLQVLRDATTDATEQVTDLTGSPSFPSIARSLAGRIDLLYQIDDASATNVVHLTRPDDASPWEGVRTVSTNPTGNAELPFLLRDFNTGNMWALWQDDRLGDANVWWSLWLEE